MKLLDSNILILSAMAEYEYLRELFKGPHVFVSEISVLEVLGYHRLTQQDQTYFEAIFSFLGVLPVHSPIITQAIQLKQQKKMSVGDSIIAATCLVEKLELFTHNGKDFSWIESLTMVDPVK